MPEATPFAALFDDCLSYDVNDGADGFPWSYWTTLSGWSKVDKPADDDAKKASIALSLKYAMHLYWSLYGVNGSASSSGESGSASVSTITVDNAGDDDVKRGEPKTRVCGALELNSEDGDSSASASIGVGDLDIYRLYEGDDTNEANFVGYGCSPNAIVVADARGGGSGEPRSSASVYLTSAASPLSGDAAYVTVNSMSFVSVVYAGHTSEGDEDLNPSGMTASASNDDSSAEASITGLQFYTYPS